MRIMKGLGLPTLNAFTPVAASSSATNAPHPGLVFLDVDLLFADRTVEPNAHISAASQV